MAIQQTRWMVSALLVWETLPKAVARASPTFLCWLPDIYPLSTISPHIALNLVLGVVPCLKWHLSKTQKGCQVGILCGFPGNVRIAAMASWGIPTVHNWSAWRVHVQVADSIALAMPFGSTDENMMLLLLFGCEDSLLLLTKFLLQLVL